MVHPDDALAPRPPRRPAPRKPPAWRALPPTFKQLDFIEDLGDPEAGPFTTRGAASDYIEGLVLSMKLGTYKRPERA